MTDPCALLPHEKPCHDCHGERRVMREVATAIDGIASEPKWEEVDCETCDGKGIIVNENRKHERDSASDLYQAFVALRTALSVATIDLEELRGDKARLTIENRRLRAQVATLLRERDLPEMRNAR